MDRRYQSPASSTWLVPAAAVLAALIIIGSITYALYGRKQAAEQPVLPSEGSESLASARVPAVNANDHIKGDPAAPIVFIEYSDFECPFCKDYHRTMQKLMDAYGADGRIAWVFRHFPLAQLHTKAPTEALASECVAAVAGNEAFWNFADILYTEGPGNDQLDLSLLPVYAERAGADRTQFEACMTEGALMAKVEAQFEEARSAGGTGTPFTVILVAGQQIPIEGAQPYIAMDAVAKTLLRNVGEAAGTLVPPTGTQEPVLPAGTGTAPTNLE